MSASSTPPRGRWSDDYQEGILAFLEKNRRARLPMRASLAGVGVVAPTVLGRVAEHPPRFVDAEQGFSLAELLHDFDAGEDLRRKLGTGSAHHRVPSRDDERLKTRLSVFQRPQNGLRPIAAVDVTPQVPLAQRGALVEGGKGGIVFRIHHVGEAQSGDAELRVPDRKSTRLNYSH